MTVQWVSEDTTKIYEYVNRRWFEETGAYPDGDEPMTIVMVASILAELHDQVCPNRPDPQTSYYHPQVPSQRNRGTLRTVPWLQGAAKAAKKVNGSTG